VVTPFFEFDAGKASRVLHLLPGELLKRYTAAAEKSGNDFVDAVDRSFKGRSSPADQWLESRSNKLAESLGKDVSGESSLETLRLKVFSAGRKYAHLQEYGGTIKPKKKKWLAFPSSDPEVVTPKGVPLYPGGAGEFIEKHKGETFFKKGKKPDTLLLVWDPVKKPTRGKNRSKERVQLGKGGPRVVFILKRQVTIPPRFGFRKTWNEQSRARVEMFQKAKQRAVAAAMRA
jgi:hypothetical protein